MCRVGLSVFLLFWLVGKAESNNDFFDQVTVLEDADCPVVEIRTYQPFMVIGHLPDGPSRYFYLFGRAANMGTALGWENGQPRRERALIPGRPAWLHAVTYIGDMPGLQILLIEVEAPRAFRLLPQRDPRRMLVATPGRPGDGACENQ